LLKPGRGGFFIGDFGREGQRKRLRRRQKNNPNQVGEGQLGVREGRDRGEFRGRRPQKKKKRLFPSEKRKRLLRTRGKGIARRKGRPRGVHLLIQGEKARFREGDHMSGVKW